jgi:hypothetical protein
LNRQPPAGGGERAALKRPNEIACLRPVFSCKTQGSIAGMFTRDRFDNRKNNQLAIGWPPAGN